MFFFNKIKDPTRLYQNDIFGIPASTYGLRNFDGNIESKGFETSAKLGIGAFTLFVGYTYTDANWVSNTSVGSGVIALTPTHSLKGDLLFDVPTKWQIAIDYEYKSSQILLDGRKTSDLLIFGIVMRRTFKERYQLFFNFENFTDVRQTRYESLNSPITNTPQFTEVWAPLDGFYMNGGIRIML